MYHVYILISQFVGEYQVLILLVPAGKAPHVLEPLMDMTVRAPEPAILECRIDPGEPPAEMHWYRDAKEVYHGAKYEIITRGNVARLLVNEPGITDQATYTCEAVNKHGRVDTKARLNITGQFGFCLNLLYTL